jgi:hypothetical protein
MPQRQDPRASPLSRLRFLPLSGVGFLPLQA